MESGVCVWTVFDCWVCAAEYVLFVISIYNIITPNLSESETIKGLLGK